MANEALLRNTGSGWEEITPPGYTKFTAVSGSSPSNVWVTAASETAAAVLLHFDGTGWTEHPIEASFQIPNGLWVANSEEVYVVGPANGAFLWDGASVSRIRLPFGFSDGHAAWGSRDQVFVLNDGGAAAITRRRRLRCASSERHCGNAIDDDCDGETDSNDSDCLSTLALSEVHFGATPYLEITSRVNEASLDGIAVASDVDCGGEPLAFVLTGAANSRGRRGLEVVVGSGTVWPRALRRLRDKRRSRQVPLVRPLQRPVRPRNLLQRDRLRREMERRHTGKSAGLRLLQSVPHRHLERGRHIEPAARCIRRHRPRWR